MKAAIFDLDGTLAETVPAFVMATTQAISEVGGQTLSLEDLRSRFGPTEEEMLAGLVPKDQLAAVLAAYYQHYAENLAGLSVYPGVKEMLEGLRAGGFRLGLLTNKGRISTLLTLEALGLGAYLDDVQTGTEAPAKPDPKGALMLLGRLSADAKDAWMVGDTAADVAVGKAAGMRTAAALWGRSKAEAQFGQQAPDLLAATPQEVLRTLTLPQAQAGAGHAHRFTVERLWRMEERRRTMLPAELVLTDLAPRADWQVADIGCGIGFLSLPLAQALSAGQVWAVDREQELLDETKRRAKAAGLTNLSPILADATKTGLTGGSVDAVVISQVLHDLSDAEAALAEAVRILRPQGVLYILEWQPDGTEFGPPAEIRIPAECLVRWLSAAHCTLLWLRSEPAPFYRLLAQAPGGAVPSH